MTHHHRFLPFRKALIAVLMILTAAGGVISAASAQQGKNQVIIRDTEIENTLRRWAEPVIRAAELDPAAVNFILIQDEGINAFVAGGPNIFIYTGLILRSDNPEEVVGVIAHELGHISGGHLVRVRSAMENASYESILGALLGIGVAVISGEGGAGAAVMRGTQSMAMNRFLSFSRVQESSADQAGLSFLEKAGVNPKGMLTFMQKLESEELLPASQQSEYIRTHPLTRNRIEAIDAGYGRSANRETAPPAAWVEDHARMKAKLKAFITPQRVGWDYDQRDDSIAADYARAIAEYRQNNVAPALKQIDALLAREPENPYFLELKGQMLADFGRVEEALDPYRKAVGLLPSAPLLRVALAHALIETAGRTPARLDEAIAQLERAAQDEERTPRIYRLLATAYGRKGQESMAKLYLAEEALLKREIPYARTQAEAALQGLEKGSRPWLRAQDILRFLEQVEKKN